MLWDILCVARKSVWLALCYVSCGLGNIIFPHPLASLHWQSYDCHDTSKVNHGIKVKIPRTTWCWYRGNKYKTQWAVCIVYEAYIYCPDPSYIGTGWLQKVLAIWKFVVSFKQIFVLNKKVIASQKKNKSLCMHVCLYCTWLDIFMPI